MAKSFGKVEKIYSLKTLGFSDVDKQLTKIRQDFDAIKKAKQSAEGKLLNTSDTAEIKKFSDEIAKLKIKEQELRVERQRMLNDQKAANIARQEELRLQREKLKGNTAEEGSIVRIRLAIRELNSLLIQKNQKGTSTINFQGEILSIDQAVAKLKQLTAAEQEFRRQFQKDQTLVGEYTTGIVNAFKRMGLDELVGGQITRTKDRLNSLNVDFDRLQKELAETRAAGKSTETIELQMIENRNEVIKLDTELLRLRTDLRGTGDVGNQVSTAIGNGFKALKGQVASFAFQFVGIAALLSKAQQGLSDAKISSDAATDLEIQLGGTADEAERLNIALSKLDTRTTLIGLQEIANVALQAGVAKENILGVTEAIDKTKVAFGKDFGSIEQGTETFAKLINIFFEDGEITGDRILQIGNSIRSLANETVASVPFITDFSGRMAGVKQISNITLPDILGLGAGFEEFKQSAEVASTTLVKVIPKLGTDIEKFAKIAGLTNEEFKNLLQDSPVEALLKVSEGLVAGRGDVEEFAKTLADAGLDAGRTTTILATLGGKADVFRQRIKRAGETITDTGAIVDAFSKKNTNLAAQMDRLNKAFSDFFASKTFQVILAAISSILLVILGNLPLILGLVTLLTVAWAAQNLTLISLRAQLILYNLGIGANLVLLNALRVAQLAYNIALFAFNGVLSVVTAALRFFGITATAASGPLGIILTIVALLGTAALGLSKAMGKAATDIDENITKMRALNEINTAARRIYTDQIAKINSWVDVIKSATTSADTKRKAVGELTKINARFGSVIRDNVIDLKELEKAYLDVTDAIKLQAKAQATAEITARKQQRVVNLEVARQEIEIATAGGSDLLINTKETDLPKEVVDLIKNLKGAQVVKNLDLSENIAVTQKNIPTIIKALTKQEEEARKEFQLYLSLKEKSENSFNDFLKDQTANSTLFEVDIKNLRDKITALDKELGEFQGSRADLQKKIAEKNRLQKELDKLLGKEDKTGSGRGSRLTGEQKDAFKDIDALRDKEIADIKIRFQQRLVEEENYLLTVLRINSDAIDEKLKLLKGANAEERKQISEFNLEKLTLEQDTNNKIFDLRSKALKQQHDQQIADIRFAAATADQDPTLSETERAGIKLDADDAILRLQVKFNAEIDQLEKELKQNSINNVKETADEIRKTKEQILDDEKALTLAGLKDAQDAGEKSVAEFKAIISKLRLSITQNDKLSNTRKEQNFRRLDNEETIGILAREVASMKIQLPIYKRLLAEKKVTEIEYLRFLEEFNNKQTELANALTKGVEDGVKKIRGLRQLLQDGLSNLFNIDDTTEQGAALKDAIGTVLQETYALARDVMNDYFDSERDRINENLELQLDRIDMEKEQIIARAQSTDEIAAIEKKAEADKRKAQRDAGEQLKKSKRAEAKIAFAIEIANIAVQASQYPFPASLIIGAILSAIAAVRLATTLGRINREQFESGGQPGEVPKKGGKFGGRPHKKGGTPFKFNGREYEAEVGELAVIRTKNAPRGKKFTVTGDQMQIASFANKIGGGIDFKPGAKFTKFESGGFLGDSLTAPVIGQTNNVINTFGGITKDDLDEFREAIIERTDATDRRIDRLKVAVDSKEITTAQDKTAKRSSIGTL